MGQRTLEVPLPHDIDCGRCAEALHERLARLDHVRNATFDNSHRKLFIEVDDDVDHGGLVGVLAAAFSGSREAPGLAQEHARHAPRPADGGSRRERARQSDEPRRNRHRLLFVALAGAFVVAFELAGAYIANSLVLAADAVHYATDVIAVLLAYLAITWGMRAASEQKTFGYQRAEVVVAFVQALGLWAVSAYFLWEVYRRIQDPPEVAGPIVALVGGLSLVANIGLASVLRGAGAKNLNVHAAYLHILSDALGSAAALGTGILVWWRGWHVADPILTGFVTVLILVFTVRLTNQTIHILLEGVPKHLTTKDVEASLRGIQGIQEIHDLHVWTLTSGVHSMSAHVVLADTPMDDRVAHQIHERIRDEYDIDHITVQVESPDCPCDTMRHARPTG